MFGKFDSILTSFLFLITSILSEWGSFYTSYFYHSTLLGSMLLVELQQQSGLSLVDVWLGLLLGDTGCLLRRQLSCEVEFSVDFYDRAGIWIVEFVTGEKEDVV